MRLSQVKGIFFGLIAAGIAALPASGMAQDWQGLKSNSQRIGNNGQPVLVNPGRTVFRWFRPNITDNVGSTVTIDNDEPLNVAFTAGFDFPLTRAQEALFSYEDNFGPLNPPEAYRYSRTVPSSPSDPTLADTGFTAQTFTWTFNGLGASARNYALYVWLPVGSTTENGSGTVLFPQRFFVYEILYGNGQRWIDVVDTSLAGSGWVRLGGGGRANNQLFAYNGTTPIVVRLINTVARDAAGNLSDTPVNSLVYADAARAVPEIGYYSASPIVSQFTTGGLISAFAALTERSVANVNGAATTVETGVFTRYDHDTGQRQYTFIPALEDNSLAFSMDNNGAGVTSTLPWTVQNTGANFKGTNFLSAPITGGAPAPGNVTYNPDTALADGSYDIYAWIPGDSGTRQFGASVQVDIDEGGVITTVIVDQSQPRGWVRLGTRRFNHVNATGRLRVIVTNLSLNPADIGKEAYADAIKFVGTTNLAITSTPVFANARVRLTPAGPLVDRDVVIVAAENGRIYCLDATGRGDGTTDVYWTYPSTPDATDSNWSDPNQVVGEDGPGGIAQMPTGGFGISSALVQRIGTEDFVFIGAKNGRVYALEMAGRGDMDLNLRKPGTTRRVWSYPNDYPAQAQTSNLCEFVGSLSFANTAAGPTIFAPAQQGRMYALDAVGNGANKTTSVRWRAPLDTQPTFGSITNTPVIAFGRIYFGTNPIEGSQTPIGRFYALNVDNGNVVWSFDGSPSTGSPRICDSFRGGAAVVIWLIRPSAGATTSPSRTGVTRGGSRKK